MLMATKLSFGDASSLLHQLENELRRDQKPLSSQSSMSHSHELSTEEPQRPGTSASYPLPSMATGTAHLRLSQPAMSMFGEQHPILPPIDARLTANAILPSTYPVSHERRWGDRECFERSTAYDASTILTSYRELSSPSPRRRTPSAMGRTASSGSGRVEGRGRITKAQRIERSSLEERSWFDADRDERKSEEPKELSHIPQVSVPEVKRKEVPYRVQPSPTGKRFPEPTPIFRLEDQVADILSSFNNASNTSSSFSNLASGFQDPLEDIHLSTILNASATPSLPATIYSLAVSNPSFFQTLRDAVPPEYCAISFFKRVEAQVYAICRRHSDYLFSGASLFDFTGRGERLSGLERTLAEDEEICLPDAKWCEAALKRRVNTIRRHLEMRKPLGRGAKEQATRALVRILWEVTDKGGYEEREEMTTGASLPAIDSQRSRANLQSPNIGLYGRLIGKGGMTISGLQRSGGPTYGVAQTPFAWPPVPSCAAPEGGEGGYFVIEALWDVVDSVGSSLNQLQQILARIKMYEARDGYIEELERLLMEAEKKNAQLEAGSDVIMSEKDLAWSRRSSVDSSKRAREFSQDEWSRDQPRAVFKRRVS